jgi:hypothetical protein
MRLHSHIPIKAEILMEERLGGLLTTNPKHATGRNVDRNRCLGGPTNAIQNAVVRPTKHIPVSGTQSSIHMERHPTYETYSRPRHNLPGQRQGTWATGTRAAGTSAECMRGAAEPRASAWTKGHVSDCVSCVFCCVRYGLEL